MNVWADWTTGKCSHPLLPDGCPPYGGEFNRVTVSGVDVTEFRIIRLAAGPGGYVEYQVIDPMTGNVEIENGVVKTVFLYGDVDWTPYPNEEADIPIVVEARA